MVSSTTIPKTKTAHHHRHQIKRNIDHAHHPHDAENRDHIGRHTHQADADMAHQDDHQQGYNHQRNGVALGHGCYRIFDYLNKSGILPVMATEASGNNSFRHSFIFSMYLA